jgi:hypothetical protein
MNEEKKCWIQATCHNSKLELVIYIYDKEKFLILDFLKKFSPLNATPMIFSLKHNIFVKIMTKPVQLLKFTDFYLKDWFSV